MGRIGELDLPERLAPYAPAWATQLLFALLCTGTAMFVRMLLDGLFTTAGPFALIYPAVLIATLFAHWQAGLLTGAGTVLHAWFFLLPVQNSFALAQAGDGPRLAVISGACVLIIVIAEAFRRAVRNATAERDRRIAERDLFLQEFDHRVKNNFALVASLLDLQRRRAPDATTADALSAALARVESIARAHRHLYRDASAAGTVDMANYLSELCAALADALMLGAAITLECSADHAEMPRDRAVSIGLVVNELVTNAAKHAFAGRDTGSIRVDFRNQSDGWRITVRDDGVGMSAEALTNGRSGGLGQRLVEAFARQAGGALSVESGTEGTVATLLVAP